MKPSQDNNQNFWISYADLMAGLLFVFILLIGAIVIKYVFMQTNLISQAKSLEIQKKELQKKQKTVSAVSNKLITTQDALRAIKILLAEEKETSYKTNVLLEQSNKNVSNLKLLVSQKDEELQKEQNLSKMLNSQLIENMNLVEITKKELAQITQKLLESASSHQKLVEDLNITKARIKNLTGIRIKAVQALKKKLGKAIEVDPNNGAIRLPSGVLFDVDSYNIKNEAKNTLRTTLIKYINTLLEDKNLRQYIDNIVIEGYTDSDGSYMYNLELSQKRALAVLDFLYSQKGVNKKLLRKYVSASGRSYSNLIRKNGKEDKEASRRIEVKFSISNKKAIQEIEDFLKSEHK